MPVNPKIIPRILLRLVDSFKNKIDKNSMKIGLAFIKIPPMIDEEYLSPKLLKDCNKNVPSKPRSKVVPKCIFMKSKISLNSPLVTQNIKSIDVAKIPLINARVNGAISCSPILVTEYVLAQMRVAKINESIVFFLLSNI
ncbi:MAG: hypothetical protein A2479_04775 [Candidatus Magasanikbacteria bacterium RIFOXYC2_FULL_39_8]|nr:MAG: hypothetical protein A2479_04775 [Candidatus Magasanikbacteria bacterium RIFOXYC2_FULL_39_8]